VSASWLVILSPESSGGGEDATVMSRGRKSVRLCRVEKGIERERERVDNIHVENFDF